MGSDEFSQLRWIFGRNSSSSPSISLSLSLPHHSITHAHLCAWIRHLSPSDRSLLVFNGKPPTWAVCLLECDRGTTKSLSHTGLLGNHVRASSLLLCGWTITTVYTNRLEAFERKQTKWMQLACISLPSSWIYAWQQPTLFTCRRYFLAFTTCT